MKKIGKLMALALALSLLLCACGEKKNAFETAQQMIGENLTALTDAIGKPNNESYASSCLGDGEDGELSYGLHLPRARWRGDGLRCDRAEIERNLA